jgi:hypothetical protein
MGAANRRSEDGSRKSEDDGNIQPSTLDFQHRIKALARMLALPERTARQDHRTAGQAARPTLGRIQKSEAGSRKKIGVHRKICG